jgi:hypothetical protein
MDRIEFRNVSEEVQRVQASDYSPAILWSVFRHRAEAITVVTVSDRRDDSKEICRALRERG